MEAICETCDTANDVSNMHRVTVQRDVGTTKTRSGGTRRGNSHSSSFRSGSPARMTSGYSNSTSSRSTTRKHLRKERVWVCNDCADPYNMVGWSGGAVLRLIVIGGLLFGAIAAVGFIKDGAQRLPRIQLPAVGSLVGGRSADGDAARESERRVETLSSYEKAEPRAPSRPRFAERKEVVQAVPTQRDDYPPCSATITDHCVDN